jgi:uncharacterized protein
MKKFLSSAIATIILGSALLAADAPKKVLVVTTTTGFRHSSIATAEKVLQKLADDSKAFTIVDFARQPEVQVPRKPNKPKDLPSNADDKAKARYEADMKKYNDELAKWTPEFEAKVKATQAEFDAAIKKSLDRLSPDNLKKYDGVIFANTTGDLPLPDKDAFIKWIGAGHAFIAMHSGSDTFHGFPAYAEMLGGEFKTHGAQVGVDLIKMDKDHPATKGLPDVWNIAQEEMYQMKTYDRTKVHDLWSLNHHPNNKEEAGHFPVSWCKKFGKGNVFYTSLGHREDVWDDDANIKDRKNPPETARQYQQHILGGIKWALGLEKGSAEPQAK